jgi:hypothetical protein
MTLKCAKLIKMRKIPLFGLSAFLLGVALVCPPATAQPLPLLSPAPPEVADPIAVTTAWSIDRIHPTGNAVLAVVLEIREGYHIMADKSQLGEVQDFKPFPTRVWVSEATEGVLSEPACYPKAQSFKADFVDAPIMSFEGQAVIYLPIQLSLIASSGSVIVQVGIEYQACAPTYCLMPQRVVHTAELVLGAQR